MSVSSRVVLAGSCIFSIGIIGYVHFKQHYDRAQIHIGVERDIEIQERRKAENIYILQQQQELTRQLRQESEQIADTG